jgi:hypothetical protein
MQGKREDAQNAIERLKSMSPGATFETVGNMWRTVNGNPTGKFGGLIGRQVDSLRDIWPS